MTNRRQELALRRQIDLAISRALVDHEYAAGLLARPAQTLDIQDLGNLPRGSLQELATHAQDIVWGHG
jgi:hypothetical protein